MATPIRIFGVQGGVSGEKNAARLFLPAGQTLAADVVLDAPVWTFAAGGSWLDVPLTEVSVSNQFACAVNATPNPPDSVALGYEYVVVNLPGGTDMTSQSAVTNALTTAINQPGNKRRYRQLYTQMGGPFLKAGAWSPLLNPAGTTAEQFNESTEQFKP